MTPPQPNPDDGLPSLESYSTALAEASRVRGASLTRDAWRRLARNTAAMAAMVYLILLTVVALLAPFWPVQAPRVQDLEMRYAEPSATTAEDWSLGLVESLNNPGPNAGETWPRNAYERGVDQRFGELSAINMALLRARLSVFGDYCLPSYLGRDEVGRDVIARLIWGARVSLGVGLLATLVALAIGVPFGAIAGYAGGLVDDLMMRFVDILYSIPFVFIIIFLLTMLSEPKTKEYLRTNGIDQLTIVFIVVGAMSWLTMARVVRGQVISLKHEQFVEAAHVSGASQLRIVARHLIPNVVGVVIVYVSLTVPSVILTESFLSFVGVGVEAPDVSWGLMASDGLKVITPIRSAWWLIVAPGGALAVTLFALNFLGDGLRDAFDPRLKNR